MKDLRFFVLPWFLALSFIFAFSIKEFFEILFSHGILTVGFNLMDFYFIHAHGDFMNDSSFYFNKWNYEIFLWFANKLYVLSKAVDLFLIEKWNFIYRTRCLEWELLSSESWHHYLLAKLLCAKSHTFSTSICISGNWQ